MSDTVWTRLLDAIVARDLSAGPPPPAVVTMRLPPIDGWQAEHVWGVWEVDPAMFQGTGVVFGGYLAALADSVSGLAMFTILADDEWFTTSDLRISFFRPVSKGKLEFVSEVIHRGRRQAHVETTLVNDEGKVVARATTTQVIIPVEGAG
jgi:uncharacterized protein (TIGR00369 family)